MTTTNVIFTLVSPAVAVLVALFGFRRSTRADKIRAFFEMYERYLTAETRAGRRALHQHIRGKSAESLTQVASSSLSSAGYALAVMNAIAIACEGKYVDTRLIALSMGRSYVSAVKAASTYIDWLESVRGFRPYPYAERLADELVRRHGVTSSDSESMSD
ncbi:hypothetical protein [Saccharothrix longispora]|uniref:DUF4760 domain-containing protein n=1 Tax=Saccharothrix longispora TaxID=33920 RepID=UPI0028FD2DAF|nr:hypothetical protein [Saccharothrix longispora]MDU0294925.1 hypothetical protein [Saccharothrix longispora]